MRQLTMQVRTITLWLLWALGSLSVAEGTVGAARPQEPETQSTEPAAQSGPEEQEREKAQAAGDHRSLGQEPEQASHHGLSGLGKDFLEDQKQIWTSPVRLRFSDADWLVPASGFAAGLFVTDRDVSTHLSNDPKTISHYKTLSNAGIAALVGGAGGLWLLSYPAHREHWRETGFLAGEAALNSLVAVETLKYSLRRERPFQGDGSGPFFHGGTSFPSEHAAAAWSVAGVIAHEYPGILPKIAAYGLASLVSYSRVRGRQHFPSDVFIGGMIGQLVAQDIYSRHHDPSLGGEAWRSIGEIVRGDGNLFPANQGSPYVPLDSWIYPAMDRLAALGFISSGFEGMRPWTRSECARLLNEADDQVSGDPAIAPEIQKLVDALRQEFASETELSGGGNNRRARVESVYTRVTGISGQPLTDAYHFAQTLINDYGRPFAEGVNNVTGFSGWATSGRIAVYVRGEYQHAPSAPELPFSARQFINHWDNIPAIPPATPTPSVSRFRLLDAYVGLNFENWQVSFGKQSLWWGPSRGGPLMFNDNAEPVNMFRVNRVSPFKLPSILGWLGPIRLEFFLGQLAGHEFVFQTDTGIVGQFGRPLSRQPFLQGERFSFKPLRDFEFGFSVTAIFAGGPTPLNFHTLLKSYSIGNGNAIPGSNSDPGDRRSGLDFTYRVPGLRQWLSFYAEAFVEDEFSPIAYWNKAAILSGIYMPRIPKIPKLDLRIEGGYTDLPSDVYHPSNNVFYTNGRYPNGYTNQGNLLGNWMGRQSQGAQAWSTYRFTPRNSVQVGYRHQKVSQAFIPGGATLTDGSVQFDMLVRSDMSVTSSVQFEKWNFPVLALAAKSNVAASLQFTFWPHSRK
jgi:membrane-associated phospholipid phosphatase